MLEELLGRAAESQVVARLLTSVDGRPNTPVEIQTVEYVG